GASQLLGHVCPEQLKGKRVRGLDTAVAVEGNDGGRQALEDVYWRGRQAGHRRRPHYVYGDLMRQALWGRRDNWPRRLRPMARRPFATAKLRRRALPR